MRNLSFYSTKSDVLDKGICNVAPKASMGNVPSDTPDVPVGVKARSLDYLSKSADTEHRSEVVNQDTWEKKYYSQQAEIARICRINTVGEMVSSLAHELGQPLLSMQNYAHGCLLRLASKDPDVNALKHALIQVIRNAEHAGEIVRRVRSYLAKHNPERKPHLLAPILEDVVSFLQPEASRIGVRLRLRDNAGRAKVVVDRVELEQVLINLVKNAFDALGDIPQANRSVDVSSVLRQESQRVVIAVADSGPGIPDVIRDTVFEPFYTTKQEGIGLGLAICRSIIEASSGSIAYGSSWLGGALFEIELPLGKV